MLENLKIPDKKIERVCWEGCLVTWTLRALVLVPSMLWHSIDPTTSTNQFLICAIWQSLLLINQYLLGSSELKNPLIAHVTTHTCSNQVQLTEMWRSNVQRVCFFLHRWTLQLACSSSCAITLLPSFLLPERATLSILIAHFVLLCDCGFLQ